MKKLLKIKKWKLIVLVIIIIGAFNASCLTPKGALRTHLFISGHPIIACITPINDDVLHNKIDSKYLQTENAHCYELVIIPRDPATRDYLQNYIVRKKGIFYFAKYYGEA
ncbi:hypothetical protein LL033_18645 [Clostridium estertheticum]|uniref:hypothetical protein n=1 Tax=Clostridium estertheticum TaxID=238834 RepID=UPI001C0ADF77|nr:hypothetical protein [Clostridium estertheticum]MBU3216417.1 hypothetical protein [Clostridium estertheticum]WAG54617.1 hypothetical protein LL033_18645 [Clostridium estertheticum]